MMMWNNLYFQNPASSSMQMVTLMYDFLSLMLISILMMLVMLSMNFFFSKEFSHFLEDDNLEMVWTLLPMLVLIYILIPSLECLYMMDSCIFCGVDVVVTGHQWYWTYNYKDLGSNILYDSYMTPLEDTLIRLLDVDNRLILPTHTPTRLMVTSADVLHSWTVPSFGLKMDAVPGRLNQICFTPMRSGVFFGQCSEICGANHSFMPIVVETVPFKDFLNSIFLL